MGSSLGSTWSRTLRHKKSLTLVCKRWNSIATRFLYQQVVLQRADQLYTLLHTLDNTNHSQYVQAITVENCFYIQNSSTDPFVQSFQSLLRRCPKLLTLDIQLLLPFFSMLSDTLLELPLLRLTNLTLGPKFTTSEKEHVVAFLATRLKTLAIHTSSDDDWKHAIHFPVLEELRITLGYPSSSDDDDDFSPELPLLWSYTALRSLTVIEGGRFIDSDLIDSVLPFVVRHGEMLKHLSILQCHRRKSLLAMSLIIPHCPNLEHLAIDHLFWLLTNMDTVVRNLRTLDILSYDTEWYTMQPMFIHTISLYPALKTIRLFSKFQLSDFFECLPYHMDPVEVLKEALTWSMSLSGLDLRTDTLLEKQETDPARLFMMSVPGYDFHPMDPILETLRSSRGVGDICVYVVRPPPQYDPFAGPPAYVEEIGSEADTDGDDSHSDATMMETSD